MSTVLREFCFENLTYGLFCKELKLIIVDLRNEIYFYHGSRMPTFWYCFEFENRGYPNTLCLTTPPPPPDCTFLNPFS